ncbi:UDP-N-acetylmuramoyl-L-alanine--D-glutamate ligase [Granulicella cerasi]|uniref:UDP-N-acetylmuramoyl-L-alanine--D-glutamate ligase n=1 Tax=Granulicella cerasi TaxID=741063 RepID=UPI0021E0B2F5|nr:UDP-N-acetylmuramoyl-L-alanine--D-glutamate ligase [Granulicella cerasi]
MELKGKRILVAGLGKSGLAAARFLKQHGARVTVSDSRPATLIAELPVLLDEGIDVETGGHGVLTFRRQDLIVISPGVPLSVPEIQRVMALGMPLIGELELGFQFLQGEVIAITGSNGKTTTTTLVGEIMKSAGRPTLVGGNIGTPVTEMVPPSTPETWSVLEVSSFQLETIETFKPRIAAVLNITPDHLDRHGSFANYAAAKTRITENQTAEDFLVLNGEDEPTKLVAANTKAQIYWFSAKRQVKRGAFVDRDAIVFRREEGGAFEPVLPLSEIPLAGQHNVENVLAAVAMAKLAGVSNEVIRETVAAFKAVEHRLEFVREVDGVRYFNDSKATNVDATAKALEAFASGVHVVLGGKDKDSDYATLAPLIRERVKTVITIGSAAEKIERQLAGVAKIESAGTLQRAVLLAKEHAVAGDVVLLAPACASFDQFENYEHRGRVFKEIVAGL